MVATVVGEGEVTEVYYFEMFFGDIFTFSLVDNVFRHFHWKILFLNISPIFHLPLSGGWGGGGENVKLNF